MHWSFLVATLVFFGFTFVSGVMVFAAAMSDSPSASDTVAKQAFWLFISGAVLAIAIIGTHWLPHIGW